MKQKSVALLAEGVDRNPPAHQGITRRRGVALLAEGVDRNLTPLYKALLTLVALLAEGVDRNFHHAMRAATEVVALLAEGVDRNTKTIAEGWERVKSPSSRRAWIEIFPFDPL